MKGKKRTCRDKEAERIAKPGRAFNVYDSAEETWDAVFEELLDEFRAAGHRTLGSKKRKLVSLVQRSIVWLV